MMYLEPQNKKGHKVTLAEGLTFVAGPWAMARAIAMTHPDRAIRILSVATPFEELFEDTQGVQWIVVGVPLFSKNHRNANEWSPRVIALRNLAREGGIAIVLVGDRILKQHLMAANLVVEGYLGMVVAVRPITGALEPLEGPP